MRTKEEKIGLNTQAEKLCAKAIFSTIFQNKVKKIGSSKMRRRDSVIIIRKAMHVRVVIFCHQLIN